MNFQKDFDELLNEILTDYRNQFPEADTSQGSLIFIKSACLASALWGLYHYQEWISQQIFPDTADTEALEHHAWVRGLTRTYNEADSALLARLLDYIRRPPAGGNKYDYIKWALQIDNVASAYCFPLAQGLGTVDVVILANKTNTGAQVPSSYDTLTGTATSVAASKLIDAAATFQTSGVTKGDLAGNTSSLATAKVVSVDSETQLTLDTDIFTECGDGYTVTSLVKLVKDHIDDVRPVTASAVRVLAPSVLEENVDLTVTGSDVNKTQVASDITAWMETLIPGQTLYRSKLVQIAMMNGADNATVVTPAGDVTPASDEIIRPGVVNVA